MHHPSPAAPRRLAARALATLLICLFGASRLAAGVVIASDFNGPGTLSGPSNQIVRDSSTGAPDWYLYTYGAGAFAAGSASGTVDANGTARATTKGVRLVADFSTAAGATWNTGVYTGALVNPLTTLSDRALLNLSLDLRVNRLHPVTLVARSYDGAGNSTGSSSIVVYPPVAGSFFRHSVDLSAMTAGGGGAVNPQSPKLEFGVLLNGTATSGWPKLADNEIVIDNLSYTAPSYYVSPLGSDAAGQSGASPGAGAFRTIQRAINASVPGDVIMVQGTAPAEDYTSPGNFTYIADFAGKNGSPARWYVLRAYPGASPILRVTGYNGVGTNTGAASYVEVRGLRVRGNRSGAGLTLSAAQADAEKITGDGLPQNLDANGNLINKYVGSYVYNGNGINFDGRGSGASSNNRVHHLRLIENSVYDHCGAGLAVSAGDHLTVQGNVIYNNGFFTRYATSGLSFLVQWNFDASVGHKSFILQNRVFGNRCDVFWTDASYTPTQGGPTYVAFGNRTLSDGNGIIIDRNREGPSSNQVAPDNGTLTLYRGTTLVQNNLSYGNGAAGLQVFRSRRVDLANNSTYQNNNKLDYGELLINAADTINATNNILRAIDGKKINNPVNTTGLTFANNLYYGVGSPTPNLSGVANLNNTDPRYVAPGLTYAADFRLQTSPVASPAINSGARGAGTPIVDAAGLPRPTVEIGGVATSKLDRGAHESP